MIEPGLNALLLSDKVIGRRNIFHSPAQNGSDALRVPGRLDAVRLRDDGRGDEGTFILLL